jgi:acyl-[acyl carrier protein]--UDP-N-acetylglucosamine O-acyltransferase
MGNDIKIHETAIIDPGAELGKGVVVGPYTMRGP